MRRFSTTWPGITPPVKMNDIGIPSVPWRWPNWRSRLEKLPHVWDTLAESYYVNGMYREAVEAAEQALAMARKKRSYYEDQLKKFKTLQQISEWSFGLVSIPQVGVKVSQIDR